MLPSEWLKLKGMTIPRIGKNVAKLEHSLTADSIVNWCNHFGLGDNIYQNQTSCTHDLAISLLGIYPTEIGDYIHQRPASEWTLQLYS